MTFTRHDNDVLSQANRVRQLSDSDAIVTDPAERRLAMAAHGAATVLTLNAPSLFSQRRPSTMAAYQGEEATPEAKHLTSAIANLIQDEKRTSIETPAAMAMFWMVNDVLTQAQALRIGIAVQHPEAIPYLGEDEQAVANAALRSPSLQTSITLQKDGNYGAMDAEAQNDIRLDIESGIHMTDGMQKEINHQAQVLNRMATLSNSKAPLMSVLGNIFGEDEEYTGGKVANLEYANISTGNKNLDMAIKSTSKVLGERYGNDNLARYGISSAQTLVAHDHNLCSTLNGDQIADRIIGMHEIVRQATTKQRNNQPINLIPRSTPEQSVADSYGLTTYEFGLMSSRGQEYFNNMMERGRSVSIALRMNAVSQNIKIEGAEANNRSQGNNLPALTAANDVEPVGRRPMGRGAGDTFSL